MTKIKMCGLRSEEDIAAGNEVKPEYIGFVFAKKSRRAVTPEEAKRLRQGLDREIKAVGVFVDAPAKETAAVAEAGTIDLIQLHGHEDEDYIRELRRLTKVPVIRTLVIRGEEDLKAVRETAADYVLLDSGTGSGETFDWSLLKDVKRPFFLAGGLDQENVEKAIESVHPFAVDVSSGIETEGRKDLEKMRAFAQKVRRMV